MQDVKEYLKSYKALDNSINQKLDELVRLKAKAEKTTSILSDMPKGGGQSREDTIIKMIMLGEKIDAEVDKYVDLRADIEKLISTVQNPTYQTVLRYRYINGLTCLQIAMRMDYSEDHVKRLNGNALNELRKITWCHVMPPF